VSTVDVDWILVSGLVSNVRKWALLVDIRFQSKAVIPHYLHFRFQCGASWTFNGHWKYWNSLRWQGQTQRLIDTYTRTRCLCPALTTGEGLWQPCPHGAVDVVWLCEWLWSGHVYWWVSFPQVVLLWVRLQSSFSFVFSRKYHLTFCRFGFFRKDWIRLSKI